MKRKVFWALIAFGLCAGSEPLRVEITAKVVPIRGTVSDRRATAVELSVNGERRVVNAKDGRFEAQLPLRPGVNQIEAFCAGPSGSARDGLSIYSSAPAADLEIVLVWDSGEADLDLHVTEPNGEECYAGNRRTSSGGVLQVDDTDGFGPEVYLLPVAPLGEYRIAVAYYEASRARRAAQTEARVEVRVRGGTPYERRMTFPVTLTNEGQTLEVGSVLMGRARE
jgi:uncharacterized protein YfaP (DUF2135 family)